MASVCSLRHPRAVAATARLIGRRPTQRMEKHCENAMKVATHLSKHPKIEWVRYCVEIISRRRRGLVDSIEKRRDI